MNKEEMWVYLRPKTGLNYGKMYCEMLNEYFVLTNKKWALLEDSKFYKVFYKDIDKIEDNNYMFVPGIQIYFKKEVHFPSSPSLVAGGLIGGLIGLLKKEKYILYFDNKKIKQIFIDKCLKYNNKIKYN